MSIRYAERLAETGVDPSVGGGCDKALAETVIGRFKTELIQRRCLGAASKTWNSLRPSGSTG